MKVTVRDKETLNEIRPLELASYLRANGWQESDRTDKAAYWTRRNENGEEFEVLLPLRRDVADVAIRMGEVLQTLEKFEKRSQLQILDDLSTTNADVVRIRTQPRDADSGSIGIEDGVLVFERARDMLLAAACAAVAPRSLYATRKPERALSYMRKVRMGQTERGSYVITLISPVTPVLSPERAETIFQTEKPFEREALTTLATALQAARFAAERSAATGAMEPFKTAVDQGVSANLCEAIVGLNEGGGGHGVEVSFSWSRSRTAPNDTPKHIVLPEDTIPFLSEAARVFRETTPLDDIYISGEIIRLDRSEGSRKITVVGFVEEKLRRIIIELPEPQYELAIKAHQMQVPITCSGDLSKEGNAFVLHNPRGFDLLANQ